MRGQGWVIGVALVVVAWGVALVTPGPDQVQAPFVISVEPGETGAGRNIAITVDAVHRAETATDGTWSADGNWLVIDLAAAAVLNEQGTLLSHVEFEIDGRTFRASERPESMLGASLSVGIPRTGSVAFELPDDLDEGTGTVRFALNPDTRVDSVIEVTLDLGAIDVEESAVLAATDWTNP